MKVAEAICGEEWREGACAYGYGYEHVCVRKPDHDAPHECSCLAKVYDS